MDAVEYLKAKNRMTKNCDMNCEYCPLFSLNNGRGIPCREMEIKFPENDVRIVEKWAKEHPLKTYAQDFLEKFPNASTDYDGTPTSCKRYIYGGICRGNCLYCWNSQMEEYND